MNKEKETVSWRDQEGQSCRSQNGEVEGMKRKRRQI